MTDLRDDLAPLLDLAGTPIEALAVRRRHRRARRRMAVAAACAAVVVVTGAGLVAVADGDDADPTTVVADDPPLPTDPVATIVSVPSTSPPPAEAQQLVVLPATARPGEIVDVFVPGAEDRGVLFTLARWDGAAWEPSSYGLTSDGQGAYDCSRCPSWVAGPEPYGVEDIGIGGPGPDRVEIPDAALPGRYRMCTGNALVELCGQFEIAGGALAAPDRPPAEHEPRLVTISRPLLRPGERFELSFPTGLPRGVVSTLQRWTGQEWTDPLVELHASTGAGGEPSVQSTGATAPAVQWSGPGPDPLVLPEELAPGWYRICSGGIEVTVCAQVRVLDTLPDQPAPTTPITPPSTEAPASPEPSTTTAPGGPPPEPSPVVLVVSPDVVWAGAEADLWFPTGATRGIPFVLQRWEGEAWAEPSFSLYSDWGTGGTPYWEVGGSPVARAIGIGGLGPDRVIIPDVAEPGTYRLCVAGGVDDVCGQLVIQASPGSHPVPYSEEAHRLELYHCGVMPTTFAGETWIADPVPIGEGGPNPPGATVGTMTQLQPDPDEARYVGSDGTVVRFVRLVGEWDPPICR